MTRTTTLVLALSALLPSAAAGQHVATSEEYAVYRAALQTGPWGRVTADTAGRLVVAQRTSPLPPVVFSGLPERERQDIDSTTISAMRQMGDSAGRISADSLRLRVRYVAMSRATHDSLFSRGVIDGWERLHRRYGRYLSLFEVSRVAFNREGTQAIVRLTILCDSLCGHGEILLMAKQDDGSWAVKRVITPISY